MMTTNTVTVELPKHLYVRLQALAKDERIDVVGLLDRWLTSVDTEHAQARPATRAFKSILGRATDLGVTDLAKQHDHYLYGTENL
jgi:hypothetical protein